MAATKLKTKAAKKPASAAKKTAPAAKKPAKKTARAAPKVREGRITHTELASADPAATKTWAQKALGWKFGPSMPTPGGDYHMWDAGNRTGGGIRNVMPPETPGTIPYVEVANIKRAYEKALKNGANPILPPEAIGGGMGSMAIISAPGGVAVGLWAAK